MRHSNGGGGNLPLLWLRSIHVVCELVKAMPCALMATARDSARERTRARARALAHAHAQALGLPAIISG